jgi:hypothetical protein
MLMTVTLLPGEASWRSRKVRYYKGDWNSIQTVLPEFYLIPFSAGCDEPANPFLQTVMRKPLSARERPMPVGTVSQTYTLAPHQLIATLCRKGLIDAGIDPAGVSYEAGLSELDEWMNFRIYLPKSYAFKDAYGKELGLRLECFNSVDGSSRLTIILGWLRFVCSNGLVIGESMIQIKERHNQHLDIDSIPKRIKSVLDTIESDRSRMERWQKEKVAVSSLVAWANGKMSEEWGKKAAARVYHICLCGRDVEIEDFASGSATEKPVRPLAQVPGSPDRATTKYDVSQAMSFVATSRNNAEERVAWQGDIPRLLAVLPSEHPS